MPARSIFGSAGETPPIFAQAASDRLTYVAHEPAAPRGEAILVPKDEPDPERRRPQGQEGRAQQGLERALPARARPREGGPDALRHQPVYLAPADARAAFERGAVDAWAIWDPVPGGRGSGDAAPARSRTARGLCRTTILSRRPRLCGKASPALDAILAAIAEVDAWAKDNTDAVAPSSPLRRHPGADPGGGAEAADLRRPASRCPGRGGQQKIADTFSSPASSRRRSVADAVRKPGS